MFAGNKFIITVARNGGMQQGRQGSSSSLVDFLYPDGSVPPEPARELPYLELPISVGIAFVPGNSGYALPIIWVEDTMDAAFTYASYMGDPPYT